MVESDQIRAILFREGDAWVAQCLEYDIGAQASDLDTLKKRLDVVIRVECELGRQIHGEPFGGVGKAPQRFFEMWEKRAGAFTPAGETPAGGGHGRDVQLALCA